MQPSVSGSGRESGTESRELRPLDAPSPALSRFRLVAGLYAQVVDVDERTRDSLLAAADEFTGAQVKGLLAIEREALAAFEALEWRIGPDVIEDPVLGTSLEAGSRIGPFTIEAPIARGGSGSVYRARQADPSRDVAIKIPAAPFATPSAERRFRQEAQMLARLHHTGIAQVIQAGTFEFAGSALPYIAMELVDGQAITSWSEARSLTDRLELLAQVCDAVEHAHQRGVIHRDLKPSNILIEFQDGPRAKVLDFGIATLTNRDLRATATSDAAALIGTIPYMSPEQVSGRAMDTRSDIYSLGVVAFEVLTGRLPYSRTPTELFDAVALIGSGAVVRASTLRRDCRGDLDAVLNKALAADPDQRYQSAGALAADLRAVINREMVSARLPTAWQLVRVLVRRHRVLAGAAAAVAFALAAGGGVAGWQAVRASQARAREAVRAQGLSELATALLRLSESLRMTPGMLESRRAILERVIPALDGLAAQPEADTNFLRDVADAYVAMARHMGYPGTPNLGRGPDAVDAFQKAIAIYARVGAADPLRPVRVRIQLAFTLDQLEHVHQADQSYQRAIDDLHRMVAIEPRNFEAWSQLASALAHRVRMLSRLGRAQEAVRHIHDAEAHLRPFEAAEPTNAEDDHHLSIANLNLATALETVGQPVAAIAQMDKGRARAVRAAALEPTNRRYLLALGDFDRRRAQVLVALERCTEAIERLETAVQTYSKVCDLTPGRIDSEDVLASTLILLATALSHERRHDEAMLTAVRASARHDGMLSADPTNDFARLNACITHRLASAVWMAAASDPKNSPAEHLKRLANAQTEIAAALTLAQALTQTPQNQSLIQAIESDASKLRQEVQKRSGAASLDTP